jgi:hypothetical protein
MAKSSMPAARQVAMSGGKGRRTLSDFTLLTPLQQSETKPMIPRPAPTRTMTRTAEA